MRTKNYYYICFVCVCARVECRFYCVCWNTICAFAALYSISCNSSLSWMLVYAVAFVAVAVLFFYFPLISKFRKWTDLMAAAWHRICIRIRVCVRVERSMNAQKCCTIPFTYTWLMNKVAARMWARGLHTLCAHNFLALAHSLHRVCVTLTLAVARALALSTYHVRVFLFYLKSIIERRAVSFVTNIITIDTI